MFSARIAKWQEEEIAESGGVIRRWPAESLKVGAAGVSEEKEKVEQREELGDG